MIVAQERAEFNRQTRFNEVIPDVDLKASIPGQYERLQEHIDAHRWYLGEQRAVEVQYDEALISWYQNVYLPLLEIIRELDIMVDFPDRTETDLYLWIISHQWYLRETLGADLPVEQVAEQLAESQSGKKSEKRGKSTPKKGV